jgi:hypothetical protein
MNSSGFVEMQVDGEDDDLHGAALPTRPLQHFLLPRPRSHSLAGQDAPQSFPSEVRPPDQQPNNAVVATRCDICKKDRQKVSSDVQYFNQPCVLTIQ